MSPDDSTETWADLNDPDSGATNPGGVKTRVRELRLRIPPLESHVFKPPSGPGGFTTFLRDDLAVTGWRQWVETTTHDKAREFANAVDRMLRRGGVIKYVPTGSADTQFIDYEPSPGFALLEEPEDIHRAFNTFIWPGIPVEILRQPYLRGVELDPNTNKLLNGLLADYGGDGRPEDWAWDSAANISAESYDPDEEAYKFTVATSSARNLRQTTAAGTAAQNDVWAGSFYLKGTGTLTGARARVVVEYLSAADAVLATENGTLTAVSTSWQRLSKPTGAAPANTSKIRVSLQMANTDATAYTIFWRWAQLEKASSASTFVVGYEAVSNDPATKRGRILPIYCHGDAPPPLKILVKPDAGSNLVEVLAALRSSRGQTGVADVASFVRAHYLQLEDGVLSNNTTAVADTGASPGSGSTVAEVSATATDPTVSKKRVRKLATTLLSSRRGWFDVYVRVKAMAASKHGIRLNWAPSLTDPATFAKPEVVHDISSASSFGYVLLNLGRIKVPDLRTDIAGLGFEVYTRRISGSGALRLDFLLLVPADEAAGRAVARGKVLESWLGKDLTTPSSPAGLSSGNIDGSDLVLQSQNEAGGAAPSGGFSLPVARHVFVLSVGLRQIDQAGAKIGEFRIRNVTDGTNTVTVDLTPPSGVTLIERFYTLVFDAAAGKNYQPQVVHTAATDPDRRIIVHQIQRSLSPAAVSGDIVRSDPARGEIERLAADETQLAQWGVEGQVPLWGSPGLNALVLSFGDVALLGYDEAEDKLARTPTVGVLYAPRYWA